MKKRIVIWSKKLLLAFIVALIWMLIAHKEYSYNRNFASVFGINLFPLIAWTFSLLVMYIIYFHFERFLKNKTFLKKLLLFVAIYWPLLIFFETIFYHLFNLKNLATASYSGLPICNCLHAPHWMQLAYFLLGPIYFLLVMLLEKIKK